MLNLYLFPGQIVFGGVKFAEELLFMKWLLLKIREFPDPVWGPDALEKEMLKLEQALTEEGVGYEVRTVKDVFSRPECLPEDVGFVDGPTLASKEARRLLKLQDPSVYTTVNCYMYYVPHFNDLGKIMSYTKAVDEGQFENFASDMGVSQLFVRPVPHDKYFTGAVMTLQELRNLKPDNKHYRIMVAPPRSIIKEWRVLVSNGRPITGSRYKPDKVQEIPDVDYELVHYRLMELSPAFPKLVYLDFADAGNGPELLEVTPLGSAGMYNMDRRKIVRAISMQT